MERGGGHTAATRSPPASPQRRQREEVGGGATDPAGEQRPADGSASGVGRQRGAVEAPVLPVPRGERSAPEQGGRRDSGRGRVGGCFVKFRTGPGRGGGIARRLVFTWLSLPRWPPARPAWMDPQSRPPVSPPSFGTDGAEPCLVLSFSFRRRKCCGPGARPSADSAFPPEAWPSGLPEGSVALCCSFQTGSRFLFASESQTQTREESAPLNERHWEPHLQGAR